MFTTPVLQKQIAGRLFKQLLNNRRTVRPTDLGIPRALVARGTPVYDAVKFSKRITPIVLENGWPSSGKEYQTEKAYIVPSDVRLTESEVQAQLLTNSFFEDKLPQEYEDSLGQISVPEEESRWAKKMLDLLEHDSHQEKLPSIQDPERPWWVFARKFGKNIDRTTYQLTRILNDFVRISRAEASDIKPLTESLECQYLRPGETLRIFKGKCTMATLSKAPLPLVEGSVPECSLQTMYPAAPEMDLKLSYDYEPITRSAIKSTDSGFNLHTIYVTSPREKDALKFEQLTALAMMQCYAFMMSSRAIYGNLDPKMALQCVYHDTEKIGFLIFQLNTLDGMREGQHVRNQVWNKTMDLNNLDANVLKHLKLFYAR